MSRINIINNKIYEVIEDPYLASKKKAAIAEWTITEDGKIMFEKIFTVPYLLNFISPMRSSYNPK